MRAAVLISVQRQLDCLLSLRALPEGERCDVREYVEGVQYCSVSSGRPVGTTAAEGFSVAEGRLVDTTAAEGFSVAEGRPQLLRVFLLQRAGQ